MPSRYSLKVRIESRMPTASPLLDRESRTTVHIWRDGVKFRVDQLDSRFEPAREGTGLGGRRITCENCERPGYVVETTVLTNPPPAQPAVAFYKLGTWNVDGTCTDFDWRFFGLSNDEPCSYKKLRIAVDYPQFFRLPKLTTRTASHGGADCLVAAVTADKSEHAVWLSAADEWHPVLFEERFDAAGVPRERKTEVAWQRTPGGHLYPLRVKHNTTITYAKQDHAYEGVVTVMHADFDSPVDPAVFTLAGFGLNENQVIGLPGLDTLDQPLWRNGRADPSYTLRKRMAEMQTEPQPATAPPAGAPYPAERNTLTLVGTAAAGVSVLTAVIAAVVWRRRAAK